MIVLELFAGLRSISKAFEARGHTTFSVDWNKNLDNISLYENISNMTYKDVINLCGGIPDVIWASPDYTTYSVAAISYHRTKDETTGSLNPKTEYAKFCDKSNRHLINLISQLKPKYWFIENPRGGLRKMEFMQGLPRYTITYCKYGDFRQKPTDIWTNHPAPQFKPPCKSGSSCHERAPRGSKTGTQRIKGTSKRAIIPAKLCEHIVNICELGFK